MELIEVAKSENPNFSAAGQNFLTFESWNESSESKKSIKQG